MKIWSICCGSLLLILCQAKADVIYSPYTEYGIALSIEGTGSYEKIFSKWNTISFWGGFGAVSAINELSHPAFGGEIAVELRQYVSESDWSGFNLGLYSGFAWMHYPTFYRDHVVDHYNSFGFVPGLKLTYKNKMNSWLIAEPYIGMSMPWYCENDPGLILTIGLRIGFNKSI